MSRAPTDTLFGAGFDIRPDTNGARGDGGDKTLRRAGSLHANSSVRARDCAERRVFLGVTEAGTEQDNNNNNNNTTAQENHDARRGDLLKSLASDSSLSSVASPVFSSSGTMPYPDRTASLHALTPLTSSDCSPPGKPPSPRSAKPSYETMHATSVSHHVPPNASLKTATDTITPVHTPPEARISIFPADGVLALRKIFDVNVDCKDGKIRKGHHAAHQKPKYATILDKVREGHTYISEMGRPAALRLT